MGGDAKGRFRNEDIDGDVGRNAGGDEMSVVFSRVVSCEEDVQSGNLDHVHACAESMAGWVRGDPYAADRVGGVIIYGFDQGECSEVVGFSVELGGKICGGSAIADPDGVLDQPFVDGFCGVGHENATTEIGLGQDVGEAHCVVEVEAVYLHVSINGLHLCCLPSKNCRQENTWSNMSYH